MLIFNGALMSYLSSWTPPTAEKGEASAVSRHWMWQRDGDERFSHSDLLHRRPNEAPPQAFVPGVSLQLSFLSLLMQNLKIKISVLISNST